MECFLFSVHGRPHKKEESLMRSRNVSVGLTVSMVALTLCGMAAHSVAQQEKVLHSFSGGDGYGVEGGLVMDASGNLYGTTSGFGVFSGGTAFELTPAAGGKWTEKVLHNFGKGTDGVSPYAGLTFDASGNLYGTTTLGGAYGWGTVFELTPNADGSWTEKVLHSFNLLNANGSEASPSGGVIFDAVGNLYGTTEQGGNGVGAIFELMPTTGGDWNEVVLYKFLFNAVDGQNPRGSLTFDSAGNLYGTTPVGGINYNCGGEYGCGTVFELMPAAGGGWTEKILHQFNNNGADGIGPDSNLIFDSAGNLYGTTFIGGAFPNCFGNGFGCGTVFELAPAADGTWTEKILHNFGGNSTDGCCPDSALIFDSSGNLYGTTVYGGTTGVGTAFELVRKGGKWVEKTLHNFSNNGVDGYLPYPGLIFDASGNLYGTTYYGGAHGSIYEGGTVFEIKR
jgi:uncharacterized repeat protein (TIGR03803 family)